MSSTSSASGATMQPTVFIDGQAGTTGLRIRSLLAGRDDLRLLEIAEGERKNRAARRALLNEVDVSILCLPDQAAREAVALIDSDRARVIDASTAHRVDERFVYGLPELQKEQRAAIARASRVANPGCYPTGVVLLLRPLIYARLLAADAPISVHALSGYTGGGNKMIDRWESPGNGLLQLPFSAPYAFDRRHKHIPEMTRFAGLVHPVQFSPAVGPFPTGMRIEIPLHASLLGKGRGSAEILAALQTRYADEPLIGVSEVTEGGDERCFDPRACNGANRVELYVLPHPDGHVVLIAVLDNLGKGAAGAAVQNLNLMLGLPETRGLGGAG